MKRYLTLAVIVSLFAVQPASAFHPFRQRVVVRQQVVVQKVVAAPIVVQKFVAAPVYSQAIVAPVYSQQVVSPVVQQVVTPGCQAFFVR